MNLNVLKKLVKIADYLDKKSLYKEADIVDSIIKKATEEKQELTFNEPKELKGLTFKKLKELNDDQKKQLATLLNEAEAHEEFSGSNLVIGDDPDTIRIYDNRRIVFLLGDDVVGFMTPRKLTPEEEKRFRGERWRTGTIFVDKNFRGKGIAPEAIKDFFKDKKGYAWISNKNTSSQNAFTAANFTKGEENNAGDSPLDQGYNWYRN